MEPPANLLLSCYRKWLSSRKWFCSKPLILSSHSSLYFLNYSSEDYLLQTGIFSCRLSIYPWSLPFCYLRVSIYFLKPWPYSSYLVSCDRTSEIFDNCPWLLPCSYITNSAYCWDGALIPLYLIYYLIEMIFSRAILICSCCPTSIIAFNFINSLK